MTPTPRHLDHLRDMCDGKDHVFFDHELGAELRRAGLVYNTVRGVRITEAGRQAVKESQ